MPESGSSSAHSNETRTPSPSQAEQFEQQESLWLETLARQIRDSLQDHGNSGPTIPLLQELAGVTISPRTSPLPDTINPLTYTAPAPSAIAAYVNPIPTSARSTEISTSPGRMDVPVPLSDDQPAVPELSSYREENEVERLSPSISDPAGSWHQSISRGPPALPTNHKTYTEPFQAYLNDPDNILRIRNDFRTVRQVGSATVYINQFKVLAAQGHVEPVHKREAFVYGLKKGIRNELVRRKVLKAPFDEMCTVATDIALAHSALFRQQIHTFSEWLRQLRERPFHSVDHRPTLWMLEQQNRDFQVDPHSCNGRWK